LPIPAGRLASAGPTEEGRELVQGAGAVCHGLRRSERVAVRRHLGQRLPGELQLGAYHVVRKLDALVGGAGEIPAVYDELDHPKMTRDRFRHLPERHADDAFECPRCRERLVQVVDRAPIVCEPVGRTRTVAVGSRGGWRLIGARNELRGDSGMATSGGWGDDPL
jgi:hypothetical protein